MAVLRLIPLLLFFLEEMISWCAFCACSRVYGRWKASAIFSIWRYFSFYICLFSLVFLVLYQVEEAFIPQELVALMGICYIVVIVESHFSLDLQYLKNILEDETVSEYIDRQRLLRPEISVSVESYHYEEAKDFYQPWTKKEITFQKIEKFSYAAMVDDSTYSRDPALLACTAGSTAAAGRVTIDHKVFLGDQPTQEEFIRLRNAMLPKVPPESRDKIIDLVVQAEIPGAKRKILCCASSRSMPFWMRPSFFWIATFLMIGWPYRWLFRAKTDEIHLSLTKKVYKNATPDEECLYRIPERAISERSGAPNEIIVQNYLNIALVNVL